MSRKLWKALTKVIPKRKLDRVVPNHLRDDIILRSRRGPIGGVVVRRYSGVHKNAAARTLQQFEKNLQGDKEYIATILEANPNLNASERHLLDLLRDPEKQTHSLARLVAEAKAEPAKVITKASYGALLLGQSEAYVEIGVSMPQVIRELRRHLSPKAEKCITCAGKGKVPATPAGTKEVLLCPTCQGEGGLLTTSEHLEFAVNKLIEMSKMGKQPGAPPVQVAIQNNTPSTPVVGIFEKIVSSNTNLLYSRPEPKALPEGDGVEPIEAEVVPSTDNPDQSS